MNTSSKVYTATRFLDYIIYSFFSDFSLRILIKSILKNKVDGYNDGPDAELTNVADHSLECMPAEQFAKKRKFANLQGQGKK